VLIVMSERWAKAGRHYIKDVVFAANDGIITTFAVVAGVRGAEFGALSMKTRRKAFTPPGMPP